MSPRPKISVLIPTYNRAAFLAECLDKFQEQTLVPSQVIVINDGSIDETPQVVKRFKDKVEYIERPHGGKSVALNAALPKVTGDYVWIFDDDDVPFPNALERLVEPLENNPQHGFSYSTVFFTTSGEKGEKVFGRTNLPDINKGFLLRLLKSNFLGGAILFARTKCYQEVGLFNTQLLRSQDYEMAIRIARRFTGIPVSGGPTFYYRQEGEQTFDQDRVVEAKRKQWFRYDQSFFRQLYDEIPLDEYIPKNYTGTNRTRQALLERMAIMGGKALYPEVMRDLYLLAQTRNSCPLSKEEYDIIRSMMVDPVWYKAETLYDQIEFFDDIRRLSSSNSIRCLRAKVARALMAKCRQNPVESLGVLRRFFYLYLGLSPAVSPQDFSLKI
jgi:glycosyltransferase involved in cell wall biosynthesis